MGHASRAIRAAGRTSRTKTLYGVSNLASVGSAVGNNYYSTAVGGGEVGTALGGWGAAAFFRLDALTATTRRLLQNIDVGSGYTLMIENANSGHIYAKTGVGTAQVFSPLRVFTASDVGRYFLLICRHTGTGLLETLCDRTTYGSTAMASYAPATLSSQLAGDGVTVFDEVTFRGSPTTAQINAMFDSTRLKGSIPTEGGPIYYGARNFTTANYLATVGNLGMSGDSAGFWGALFWRPDALPSAGSDILVCRQNNPANSGWTLSSDNVAMRFGCSNAGAYTYAASAPAIVAADVGQLRVAIFVHTGSTLVLYTEVNGALVQSGAPVGVGAFTVAPTPMSFGIRVSDLGAPAARSSILGFSCGHAAGGISAGQAQALFTSIKDTGRIQGVAGLTDHLYDLAQDVTTPDALPSQVLDRVGTDHLAKYGIDARLTANSIRGIGPYSTAEYLQTANGGGLQGAATMHLEVDVVFTKVPTTNEMIVHCTNGSATTGWYLQAASNQLRFFTTGGGFSSAYTILPGDIGQRLRVVVQRTADNGALRLYINGVQVGSDVATQAYVPNAASTLPMVVGFFSGMPALSAIVEAVQGGNALLTAGEITALNADRTTTLPVVAGKMTKRYVFEQDIAAASGILPALASERITGNDNLVRLGNPLVVAEIGIRITHRWSVREELLRRPNPANVKVYGAKNFSIVNHYTTANGLLGSASGFAIGLHIRPDRVVGSTDGRLFNKGNTFNNGWCVQVVNGALRLNCFGSAGASDEKNSPGHVLTVNDVGRSIFALFVHDGSYLRTYAANSEIGLGTPITGYASPGGAVQYLGRDFGGITDGSAITVFGGVTGHVVPTKAQALAWLVACEAAGKIQTFTGAEHLYDVTQDVGVGTALPATLTDRIGSDHLIKQGHAVRATANSIRGVGPYGVYEGWLTAPGGGVQGAAAGFHGALDVWFTKVPTTAEMLVACENSGATVGWFLQCNLATLRFIVSAGGNVISGTYTITNADLNKRTRITWQSKGTGNAIQLFVNGVQAGTDVTLANVYAAPASTGMAVGYFAAAGSQNFSSGYIESFVGGNAVLTNGEIATLNADLTQSPPTIPGKTAKRYIFETDIAAAGGDLPLRALERISGSDDLNRFSYPLELAAETVPSTRYLPAAQLGSKAYGAANLNASNNLSTANGVVGALAGGFTLSWYGRIDSQAVSAGIRILASKGLSAQNGWSLDTTSTNTSLRWRIVIAASTVVDRTVTLPASLLGQMTVITVQIDAAGLSRVFLNGFESGTAVVVPGYVVPSAAMTLGFLTGASNQPDAGVSWFGFVGGLGAASPAQILEHAQLTEAAGRIQQLAGITSAHLYDPTQDVVSEAAGLPATILDRIGTDHLARNGAPELAIETRKTPPTPWMLTDTITGLPKENMLRMAAPVLKSADPSIDGRRLLGAQGFSASSFLKTAPGGGIRGSASGFWVHWYGRLDAVGGGFVGLAYTSPDGGTGWQLYLHIGNNQVSFNVAGTSTTITLLAGSVNLTLTSLLGRPAHVQVVYDGANLNIYLQGQLVGSQALSGGGYLTPAGTVPMSIGARASDGVHGNPNAGFFGLQGGDGYVPSLAELQTAVAETDRTGSLTPIPGSTGGGVVKTQHAWDLTRDILSSGVDAVPASVLDRIGTDHLTRVGIEIVVDGASRAIRQLSDTEYFRTALGGGLRGHASGFWQELLINCPSTTTATTGRTIAWCYVSATGYQVSISSTGVLSWALYNGGSAVNLSHQLTAGQYGRKLHLAVVHNGTNATLYVDGASIGSLAVAYVAPNATIAHSIGIAGHAVGYAARDIAVYGHGGGDNFIPSAGEIATAAATALSGGRIVGIPGKDSRRYDLAQDALDAGTLPVRSAERVSGADVMLRTSAGLALAPRTEHPWSYEVAPITKLASGFSASARYESANGQGVPGINAGFFIGLVYRVVSTFTGRAAAYNDGNWAFVVIGGTSINFSVRQASDLAVRSSPTLSIAADGKLRTVCGVYDGATVRAYAGRTVTGTTSVAGYSAPTASVAMILGALAGGSSPATGIEILGFVGGHAFPSAHEIASWEDFCIAREEVQLLGGLKTEHMYSANRKSGSTLLDLVGNHNLVAVATPTETALYARAWAS